MHTGMGPVTPLATDRTDNVHALARPMEVQGIIFGCHACGTGMEEMGPYSYCFGRFAQ